MPQSDNIITADEYVRAIVERLSCPDENVRKTAVKYLEEIDDPQMVKILAEYQNHGDNMVRYSVRKALVSIKNRSGDKFDSIIVKGDEREIEKKPETGYAVVTFIVIAIFFGAAVYMIRDDGGAHTPEVNISSRGAAKESGTWKLNVVRFVDGKPMIKIAGQPASIDRIKREAVFMIGERGGGCIVSFPDELDISALTMGRKFEVEGEIVRNDNVNPPLVKCGKLVKAGAD